MWMENIFEMIRSVDRSLFRHFTGSYFSIGFDSINEQKKKNTHLWEKFSSTPVTTVIANTCIYKKYFSVLHLGFTFFSLTLFPIRTLFYFHFLFDIIIEFWTNLLESLKYFKYLIIPEKQKKIHIDRKWTTKNCALN